MIRSILSGLFGLFSVIAVGILPSACESGGVGDPCLPEDEYSPQFAGFKVTEENIESRSFQCQTRICLVNHFQGRVSCPLGQPAPAPCNGPDDTASCGADGQCVQAAVYAPDCKSDADCGGRTCNLQGKFCECVDSTGCPQDGTWFCGADHQCKAYVCHNKAAGCQDANSTAANDKDKPCCVPGTDVPVVSSVCGQCAGDSKRDADQAVYCSCRCGVAQGEKDDPNFNFCECPKGFTCSEIRKNVGLGDEKITGKYCIKQGSEFTGELQCGRVEGHFESGQCKGSGAL
jgi:hypothetical protein